jgi:diguanylate cyclase (GGDEF)-like protein
MVSELKSTGIKSSIKLPRISSLSLVAIALIVVVGLLVDLQNRRTAEQELRISVREQIGLIRTRLEGNIHGNIHLVRGLISTLKTEPHMQQDRFAELAGNLFTDNSQLRNIAGAPDLVISLMYPMAGNEKAIGLNYRKNADQRATALKVRDGGELVIAGPLNLVQGGQGLIGRFPVFTLVDGNRIFWGIVSAVIDVQRLYEDSGLLDPDLPIEIAIVGRDAAGAAGEQFFGTDTVLSSNPVLVDLALPNGSWQLAAVPKTGWDQSSYELWTQRLLIAIAGFLVFLPILIAGRLSDQRREGMRDLQLREDKLQRLSRRLELALDASKVGVWELNMESGELVWDDRMRELYGLPNDVTENTVEDWQNALHPDDFDRAQREFEQALGSHGQYRSDFRIVLGNGEVRNIRAKAAVYDEGGAPRIIGVNWDVTTDVSLQNALKQAKTLMERRNTELEDTRARIEHMALHDSLTGLPNRRFLDTELSKSTENTDPKAAVSALLIVDLDRFKQINDTFGHPAGDALLVHVSEILSLLARPTDFVARIGGDEFVIVCKQDTDAEHLNWLANSIVEQMRLPMLYDGSECRFGVSVGISTIESGAIEVSQLLVNADLALYQAKSTGRNRFAFFTSELQANTLRTKMLADDILRGIEEGEFVPFYQPQFCADNHAVTGVEALARWQHPERGIVSPDEFLGVAEEFNVTAAIDRVILRQTLEDMKSWSKNGLEIPRASVNVSAQRLQDSELLESLEGLNIAPGTLSFELVESIFLDDSDEIVVQNIERIKKLGIDIEIDDFGTGRTSIISLLKLNPRRLKIDRQLIIPMTESRASRKLAKSVVEIGKSLNIEVVAEGVETMRHAQLLQRLGCDILQGYVFARPMSADDLVRYMKKPMELSA